MPDDELPTVASELYDEGLSELRRRTSATVAADVLEHLDADDVADVLEDLPAEASADILDQMVTDHAVAVLEELRPNLAVQVAASMELADARVLLQTYAEGAAGRLMTPNPFAVSDAQSAAQALEALRGAARESLGSVATCTWWTPTAGWSASPGSARPSWPTRPRPSPASCGLSPSRFTWTRPRRRPSVCSATPGW